ncbi:hypothetical protein COCON_G00080210 [Conger conger]|uniref:SH2 domain-containing protein n=1 Tax=Conger conger TaxID=82655 RepID=A0A9Q1DPQ0_CONCO|nr:hypothetical protein COCON_G00080210 [Conger conger]
MSFDNIPSKAEVMRWQAPQLADYMRKMDLGGCDKVIMKHTMTGQRFLTMSDNDLQKFPKLHTPLISKICREINKKEEKRGFFPKKTVHKYPEPVAVPEDVGWDSEEFDQSDDDYESPDADGGDGSGGDYESPVEEDPHRDRQDSDNDNYDYEPPPSEPLEELPRQICPAKPLGDSDYIDNNRIRGVSMKVPNNLPPVPPSAQGPDPPPSLPVQPSLRYLGPSLPDVSSLHRGPSGYQPNLSQAPGPQVDRSKKPTTLERGLPCLPTPPERDSPGPERKPWGIGDRATHPRRPPVVEKPPEAPRLHKPPVPGPGVGRRVSSVGQNTSRPFAQDRNDGPDDVGGAAFSSNTFPLSGRSLPPRPGMSPAHFDSLPSSLPATASLPSRLQPAVNIHRSSSRSQADHCPRPPPQPQRASIPVPEPESEQDLNPQWYVGPATRAVAEGNLRRINQDGTFLVRDSSRGSSTQPYTLMVLYQDKVYNIQIRYNADEDIYLLGTGFKISENFLQVKDIIAHHRQTPLLLIDAKDRRAGQQCLLTHAAGY